MAASKISAGKTFLAILFALALLALLLRSNAATAQLTVSWSYDYSNFPPCSSNSATHCIDHFEIQNITNPGSIKLLQTIANSENRDAQPAHFSTSLNLGPFLHDSTIAVVAVGRDEKGNRTSSNPYAARATLSRKLGSKVSVAF